MKKTLFCLFLLLPALVFAEQLTARQWLDKMSRSHKALSYQGVLSYRRGDDLRSLKVLHGVVDGKEYERLVDLDGQHFEIIKHGHDLACVHVGDSRLRLEEHAAPRHFSHQHDIAEDADIESCYELSVEAGHRVADRSAVKIVLKPRDEHRYQRVFMLEQGSGLLLQNMIVGLGNKVLEEFKFLDIEFKDLPPSELRFDQLSHPGLHVVQHPVGSQSSQQIEPVKWQLSWLPKGFVKTENSLPVRKNSTDNLVAQMYSDGASSFTLFIDRNPNRLTGYGKMQKGATSVIARAVGEPDLVVTIAGEIPLRTAQKIAASVEF